MKMKNILLSAVTVSTLSVFGLQGNNASAKSSSWHKGVPTKIKGYWVKDGNSATFQKNGFTSIPKNSTIVDTFMDPLYKSVGNNKFIIKPDKNNKINSEMIKFNGEEYIKVNYSNNKISVKGKDYSWNNMHRISKPE